VKDEDVEVVDTLRWPSAQDKFPGKEARERRDKYAYGRNEQEEEVVLENAADPDEEEQFTVKEWLEIHSLGMYADTFEAEGWDSLDAVHTMTQEDMLDIGVKRGHVRRLMLAMGREPPPMRMESMSRTGSISMARSMARGTSYARNRMDGSVSRAGWGYDERDRDRVRAGEYYDRDRDRDRDWRAQADRESGLKANVKVHAGPGGSSRLTEAGGLGAFLMGGDVDDDGGVFDGRRRR